MVCNSIEFCVTKWLFHSKPHEYCSFKKSPVPVGHPYKRHRTLGIHLLNKPSSPHSFRNFLVSNPWNLKTLAHVTDEWNVIRRKYRLIKKAVFTWWLQYGKLQVTFKVSPASLQTFIDTPNCFLEDRVQYSTVHIPIVSCDGKLQIIFLRVFVL
jgi:hypothetical protein